MSSGVRISRPYLSCSPTAWSSVQEVVLGVDVGTSSLKAGLFTLAGTPLGFAQAAYGLASPEPDAVEQDPDDWWRALASVSRQLLASAPDDPQLTLLAVAIGGQAPTLAAVDADLRPTYPAISWLDQRPAAEAERLYARLGQSVPVWGSWPAQAAWLIHQRPSAMQRTRWLFGCPDYLAARLTGRPVSFLSWPAAEIEAAEIDTRLLPPQQVPGEVIGGVTPEAAEASGLPAGTPVVAGYVDGILGVLGSGVRRPGDACMNSGTSGTFSVVSATGLGYPVMGMCVVGAATNTSGKALDWFVQQVGPPGSTYIELLAGASEVAEGSGGLLFLPHLAGERAPVRDPRSRGAWVGLTLEHDRRHLLRSLLEGVAFSFRAVQESLAEMGAEARDVRVVGGQARSDLWNQIKADVLNRPVLVPEVIEAAVVGAAILGAIGLGAYASREEAVSAMVRVSHSFVPDRDRAALYEELYADYCQLYPALRETNWRLHDLPAPTGTACSTEKVLAP
jgi:xylulokinase